MVATLALVLAASGAGYAAGKIGTRDLVDSAVTSAKVKDGTLQPADLGPAVARTMQVRAYTSVVVSPSFEIDTTRTKGFSTLTHPDVGVYCLTLTDPKLDASTTAPVISVDWDNSSGTNLAAYLSKSAFGCPEGTDLGVRTFSFRAGKPFRPADTVAFTLLVP